MNGFKPSQITHTPWTYDTQFQSFGFKYYSNWYLAICTERWGVNGFKMTFLIVITWPQFTGPSTRMNINNNASYPAAHHGSLRVLQITPRHCRAQEKYQCFSVKDLCDHWWTLWWSVLVATQCHTEWVRCVYRENHRHESGRRIHRIV